MFKPPEGHLNPFRVFGKMMKQRLPNVGLRREAGGRDHPRGEGQPVRRRRVIARYRGGCELAEGCPAPGIPWISFGWPYGATVDPPGRPYGMPGGEPPTRPNSWALSWLATLSLGLAWRPMPRRMTWWRRIRT